MRRARPEDALQRAVVQYLAVALPEDAVFFAIPLGGARSKVEAAIMQGLGVRAGLADLCVIWRGFTLFIELKADRGSLSPEQIEMADRLQRAGAWCYCARSVDDVATILRLANIPLRAELTVAGAAPCRVVMWWPKGRDLPAGWRLAKAPKRQRPTSHDFWSVMLEMEVAA